MNRMMFLGTSSAAGKTLISAVYCRYLCKKGVDVVPFKASTLTSSIHNIEDGRIMGMEQAIQAWASEKVPDVRMNPVLLMHGRSNSMSVYVDGRKEYVLSAGCRPDSDTLFGTASDAFDELSEGHDVVVCEGYGSPVEMNLRDDDIANMRVVLEKDMPAVLVADIERGGVFAAIYGTWKLMDQEERSHLKGYIINRFRGDDSVLRCGIDRIEELTGLRCFGVVPYIDIDLPKNDHDGVDIRSVKEVDRALSLMKDHIDLDALDSL